MEVTEVHFRDKAVAQVSVGYDWASSENYAIITMAEADGSTKSYRINGLTEYAIYEDFSCGVFDQCKLIRGFESVYLSLDPYSEIGLIEDKDNFFFRGKSIEHVSARC
ncbi:hypothetical protein [Microbulbifer aggregans]|uniref:hypothetical protein n=1 Tax=Microbulbifer aggregans TaxID=1769779 RepID=UPI001CFEAEE6|nr:hypothetical protein [Microbulbifer aggregans]